MSSSSQRGKSSHFGVCLKQSRKFEETEQLHDVLQSHDFKQVLLYIYCEMAAASRMHSLETTQIGNFSVFCLNFERYLEGAKSLTIKIII